MAQELKGKLNQGIMRMYPELQEKTVKPIEEVQEIVPDEYIYGLSKVTIDKINADEITVKSTEENQVILPDEDNYFKQINVEKVNLQEKEVQPREIDQVIKADENFDALKQVTVKKMEIQTEKKTVKSNSTENQIIVPTEGKFINEIEVEKINLQEKEIMPQIYEQNIEADNLFDGMSKLKIGAVTSQIDDNIIPTNIRKGKTILGVEGNLEEDKPDQEKIIEPTTARQEVFADVGYELAKVTVEPIQTQQISVKSSEENEIIVPSEGKFINEITVEKINLQDKEVTPTVDNLSINADEGFDGLKNVIVNAIQTEEKTVKSSDEIQVVEATEGKFINKIYVDPINLQEKTAKPTTETQEIYADNEYDGLRKVIIDGVDSSIDSNIIAENIKAGTTILNTEGTFTSDATATSEDIAVGKVAYSNGERLEGTLEPKEDLETELNAQKQIIEDLKVAIDGKAGKIFKVQNGIKFGYSSVLSEKIDTSEVTDMSYMFSNCSKLTSMNLSGFDTSNVIDMTYMFNYCNQLTSLDVSGFDTSKVTNMSSMFYYCSKLTSLDLSKFNTSNVKNMQSMFNGSGLTSLDLSKFDTSNVTNMGSMFSNCSKLESLNLNGFDTTKVNAMQQMFSNCSKLTNLDISSFDTLLITSTNNMFYNCKLLADVNVDHFKLEKVTMIDGMFGGCSLLTDESLNSILKMCRTAIGLATTNKTLKRLGLTSTQATICQTLPNWSELAEAGWTTGY